MGQDDYQTIVNSSKGEYKEKGSRFMSYAFSATSEEEIKNTLNQLRQKHHTSRHVCFAYSLGIEQPHVRASDAGEPSNTAGRPILTQIQSRELTNVLVVVVRYFGGTKLGTAGLINAYRTAAALALDKAKIITRIVGIKLQLEFDYSFQSRAERLFRELDVQIIDQEFNERCRFTILVSKSESDKVVNLLGSVPQIKLESIE